MKNPLRAKAISKMPKVSYLSPFMLSFGKPGDPHDCWQEDGFWPDKINASLDEILVWGTEIGLSYLNNGGMIHYLQFISGRTLPEMELGFGVLGCPKSMQASSETRKRFSGEFPRQDKTREAFVASDEPFFEECGSKLWAAMESDCYERSLEEFAKNWCIARSLPPWTYPNLP